METKQISIKTLSSVHIGSGNILQQGSDYCIKNINGAKVIHVFDMNAFLHLIDERYLPDVVAMMERDYAIDEILQKVLPQATLSQVSKYQLYLYDEVQARPCKNLKEFIKDGHGKAYLPGSSIKGALRTALLANEAEKKNFSSYAQVEKFEKSVFGKNPQDDVFKYLQVGDAYFEESDLLIAVRISSLNYRDKFGDLSDSSKDQYVEVLQEDNTGSFRIKLLDSFKYQSIGSILDKVNQHTKRMLESEIDFWNDCDKDGAENYVDELQCILDFVNDCVSEKECVVRIGHGSGWRFMTGAWTEKLPDSEFQNIVDKSRPQNKRYQNYFFPKSRRVEQENSRLLGFVKMSIQN